MQRVTVIRISLNASECECAKCESIRCRNVRPIEIETKQLINHCRSGVSACDERDGNCSTNFAQQNGWCH